MICKTSGKVIFGHCNCAAGLGESCSHVASLLQAVEAGVQKRDSYTEKSILGSASFGQRSTIFQIRTSTSKAKVISEHLYNCRYLYLFHLQFHPLHLLCPCHQFHPLHQFLNSQSPVPSSSPIPSPSPVSYLHHQFHLHGTVSKPAPNLITVQVLIIPHLVMESNLDWW